MDICPKCGARLTRRGYTVVAEDANIAYANSKVVRLARTSFAIDATNAADTVAELRKLAEVIECNTELWFQMICQH